jgi:cold-inducible RNA-binding protein
MEGLLKADPSHPALAPSGRFNSQFCIMNIYVANLPYTMGENELRALFEEYGTVDYLRIVTDRDTGRSKGFGFVEMPDDNARAAIEALDGYETNGRNIKVVEARPRPESGGGSRGRFSR